MLEKKEITKTHTNTLAGQFEGRFPHATSLKTLQKRRDISHDQIPINEC